MKPTSEQTEEFWKWCGLREVRGEGRWQFERYKETNHWWEAPNGRRYRDLPQIDFNNLFEWGVPMYIMIVQLERNWDEEGTFHHLFKYWLSKFIENKGILSFEDALFWTIWEVRHNLGM